MAVLDEVHPASNPSRLWKIAADALPELRILATGSSASAEGPAAFGVADLGERFLHGGLRQAFAGASESR